MQNKKGREATLNITYRKAEPEDAEVLVEIYNAAFYNDYVQFGECPGYGRTKEAMEESIMNYPKFIIFCDSRPVGCISCKKVVKSVYEIGCLCVIPEYQGKGIGTQAVAYLCSYYSDWTKFALITPAARTENIKFYTEKCGFTMGANGIKDNVEVVQLLLNKGGKKQEQEEA